MGFSIKYANPYNFVGVPIGDLCSPMRIGGIEVTTIEAIVITWRV